ncbi:hypothetical protein LTR27_010829 [Elasticomyces elasticus]|nr:hypothetical protein LTR27_010829 [Elasticomyces elasticus]
MDALAIAMQSDRLITLAIGTKPQDEYSDDYSYGGLMIWASALEASTEYFRSALRNQHLGTGGEQDVLTFPVDDFRAWQVMHFWMLKHELPPAAEIPEVSIPGVKDDIFKHAIWVLCWIMGDKYGIPSFQDLVMLELIRLIAETSPSINTIKYSFEQTAPGSLLRELMAEELAMLVANKYVEYEDLESFRDIAGFLSLHTRKMDVDTNGHGDYYERRLPEWMHHTCDSSHTTYLDFMVLGVTPNVPWLHKQIVDAVRHGGDWEIKEKRDIKDK